MNARYYGVQQAEPRLLNSVREGPDRNGEVDKALLVADHVLLGGRTRRAMRAQVVVMAVAGRWAAIDEGMVPRIHRHLLALQIWTIPLRYVRRTLNQRLQPLFGRRVTSDVQLVEIEYRCKAFDGLEGDRPP